MGYIGDSRAILGSKDSSDSMVAIQLTVDLKPDLPSMSDIIIVFSSMFWLPACCMNLTWLMLCKCHRGS